MVGERRGRAERGDKLLLLLVTCMIHERRRSSVDKQGLDTKRQTATTAATSAAARHVELAPDAAVPNLYIYMGQTLYIYTSGDFELDHVAPTTAT